MEDRHARRFGLDIPAVQRQADLEMGTGTGLAEAAFHEFRTRYAATHLMIGQGRVDPDHYAISAFAAAWDQCLEALIALTDTPDAAEEVWRLWSQGMLAQGRAVAPERLAWESLSVRDRELDQQIAAGMGVFLGKLLKRKPAEGERGAARGGGTRTR